jgi:hypothetical protein
MKNALIISILLLVTSCATPYQSKGLGGGYTDSKLAGDNTYMVNFQGNSYTSADEAYKSALRRCAELTKQNGYSYFVIFDSSTSMRTSTYVTPVQSATDSVYTGAVYENNDNAYIEGNVNIVKRPYVSISIKMYKNSVPQAYSAEVMLNKV